VITFLQALAAGIHAVACVFRFFFGKTHIFFFNFSMTEELESVDGKESD